MKAHLLMATVVAVIASGLFAPNPYALHAQSVPLPDCRVWGRQLEEEYIIDQMTDKNAEAASELAPGFQSVRPDGIRNRAGEIPLVEAPKKGLPGAIHAYKVTYSGNVAILTYKIRRHPAGGNRAIQNYGVLSVWKPTAGGWQCIARSETPLS